MYIYIYIGYIQKFPDGVDNEINNTTINTR